MSAARAAALCVVLAAACTEEPHPSAPPPPPPAPPLSRVVEPAIMALEQAVGDVGADQVEEDEETVARIAGLLDTLRSTRGPLRGAAVAEFKEIGEIALGPLEERLAGAEADPETATLAVEAVAAVGTWRAADLLMSYVEDGLSVPRAGAEATTWLRDQCAWRLSEMEEDLVVPRLALCLRYLRSEADYRSGVWIAGALAAHENYSGVRVLREIVASGFPETLRTEAWDMGQRMVAGAGPDGIEDLADLEARWDAARTAPVAPSDALKLAVWRRIAHFRDFQLRDVDDARYALGNLGAWAAEILGAALSDEHLHVRVHSAQALERMGLRGAGAGAAVRRALDDPELGPQAAATLAAIDPVGAPPTLVTLAAPGRRLELRAAALRALAMLAGPETPALRDLVAPLTGPNEPLELRSLEAEVVVRSAPLEQTLAAARLVTEAVASGQVDPTGARRSLAVWLRRLAESGSEPAGVFLTAWEAPPIPGEGLTRFTRLAAELDQLLPGHLRSRTAEDR